MKINIRGTSIIELIFAMAIFSLVTMAMTTLFINGLRWNSTIWDQLSSHTDSRKIMENILHDVRKAEASSIGSYPIESAAGNEVIFFANLDADALRERVRYTLVGTTIKRGVTKPSGVPLRYVTSSEQVVDIAHDVKNTAQGVPLFTYFKAGYTGVEAPLPEPVSTTLIRAIKTQVELERDPNASPVPFHVESFVFIRNFTQSSGSSGGIGSGDGCDEYDHGHGHGHDECDDDDDDD